MGTQGLQERTIVFPLLKGIEERFDETRVLPLFSSLFSQIIHLGTEFEDRLGINAIGAKANQPGKGLLPVSRCHPHLQVLAPLSSAQILGL